MKPKLKVRIGLGLPLTTQFSCFLIVEKVAPLHVDQKHHPEEVRRQVRGSVFGSL
jgi:hypothetical protein